MTNQPVDCIIPESAQIAEGVTLGPRVVLAGDGIVLRQNARLDAAAVIGADVTIGQGAWVRAGAVVLRSVPPNAIVEGNPAQVVGYLDGEGSRRKPDPKHIDIHALGHLPRPSKVDLGVGNSARLCCTNPKRDSSCESSMVAGWHEQTDTPDLQDQELAGL